MLFGSKRQNRATHYPTYSQFSYLTPTSANLAAAAAVDAAAATTTAHQPTTPAP